MQTKIKSLIPLTFTIIGLVFAATTSFYISKNILYNSIPESAKLISSPLTSHTSLSPANPTTPTRTSTKAVITPPSITKTTSVTPSTTPTQGQNERSQPYLESQAPPSSALQPTPTHPITITLQIDSNTAFPLTVNSGQDHCDILNTALSQGKLNSVNMRHNPTFNSYAVYQINGLGVEGQVWWTYTVNGQSPPLGCSLVIALDGDSVRWSYIGPR